MPALLPEAGMDFDLHVTVQWGLDDCERVSMWGPYQICREPYCWAAARKAELDSGSVRYKANDMGRRSNRVSNCIHAVSTIIEGPRLRVGSPGWGEMASWYVLKEFRPYIIDRQNPDFWVSSALGLDQYPIMYRDFRNPLSGGIVGPPARMFGNERNLRSTYGAPR
jgi:hypothetical protein